MNSEDKLTKTITRVGSIGIILFPILTILYSIWVQSTPLFIFLQSYEIILYIGNLILWIGVSLTLAALLLRKRFILGFVLFIITTPCLSLTSLGLMRASPSTAFFANLPVLYDHKQLGINTYYLTSEGGDQGHQDLHLYKCGNKSFYCEPLFVDQDRFGSYLVVDRYNNEVNIVNHNPCGLLYSYGEHPHYYESCQGAKLGGHIYYLSYLSEGCTDSMSYHNYYYCDFKDTFTLYECSSDNILCIQIPFEYKTNDQALLTLVPDEVNYEINVYDYVGDNETLIYTWGKHPRCYVEGCTILEQK